MGVSQDMQAHILSVIRFLLHQKQDYYGRVKLSPQSYLHEGYLHDEKKVSKLDKILFITLFGIAFVEIASWR